jgi:ABC-type oligopeptide transport system ATPase subunit
LNRYTNPAPTHFKDTFKNHDLATAYYISDRIIVMQKGIVVESGEARAVLNAPQHPYSRQLRAAVLLPEVAAVAPSATLSP